jgi:hypothetical protein
LGTVPHRMSIARTYTTRRRRLSSITRAPCRKVMAARHQKDAPARHGGCQSICGIGWSALTDMAVLRGCVDKFVN